MPDSNSESSKETSDSEPIGTVENVDIEKATKQQDNPQSDVFPNADNEGAKYFFQSANPMSSIGQPASSPLGNGPNSQTNQLLRMAALSMMSKLFSALRNQG